MRIFSFSEVLSQIPNIIFRRRLKFKFELLPFEAEDLPLKKITNFFLAGMNQFFLPSKPFGYPVVAQIEPTNNCNLSCSLCLGTLERSNQTKNMLSLNTFKKFIDELGDYLLLIVLWKWGEPFLNKDIIEMITYAKKKKILVHLSTNGNVIYDEKKADELVDCGLDSLVFGVDGATEEAYSKYRRDGDLRQVKANIRTIVELKKRKKSKTPRITLRFVVMRHNEKEIPLMKQLAEELEVDFLTFRTSDLPSVFGEAVDMIFSPDQKKYQRYDYETGTYVRKQLSFSCMRPWKRLTLDATGEIIPCEFDYRNQYVFGRMSAEQSVMSIWKGSTAINFRKNFNLGNNDYYFCKDCTHKNMVVDDFCLEEIS